MYISLLGKDPNLAFTTLSLFFVTLEESKKQKTKNNQKRRNKNKNEKPQPTNLIQQTRNKGEEHRDDIKISRGVYNLLAASLFLTIWVYMKSASLPHLYVYEVKKIGTCTQKIIRQVMCLTMFGDLMPIRGGFFKNALLS